MHLGNSVICPVTGIPMLIAAGAAAIWAFKKSRNDFKEEDVFKMVSLTMFVFALQMINFAIPQTGSSGHIIGAVLLSALLGKYKAFLSMCTILTVQALFFNDGGLLSLGCNIFNMGVIACFVVYPLFYKPIADKNKPFIAALLSSILSLQIGSVMVVLEGILSGSISINNFHFLGLMLAIHLPIGIVEGLFSAVTILIASKEGFTKKLSYTFSFISLILGGLIAQFASTKPDGLEWSLLNISESFTAQTQGVVYAALQSLQDKISILSGINPIIGNILGIIITAILMIMMIKLISFKLNKQN